jgi:hypothetical protein
MNAMTMPKVTVREVRAIIGKPRTSTIVQPREPHELKQVIVTEAEFFATMRGYRKLRGLSQLAADDMAGSQEGYIGKLEIGMRKALHTSFWWWLGALRLVMILVPAVDAVRADTCPCCGAVKR